MSFPRCIIKHPPSQLVLDGTSYNVTVNNYNGGPAQQWMLEPAGNGFFFLINVATGNAMDIEGGADIEANIVTYPKHGGENQQWSINYYDSTITNAYSNLAIDIFEGNVYAGNRLIAYEKHGNDNQMFQIQYV